MRSIEADRDNLRRLEPTSRWLTSFVAKGGTVMAAGPFRALLAPHLPGSDYAAPTEPLGPEEDIVKGLHALRGIFADHGSVLRLEFNEPLFPSLPGLLEREGFEVEEREPLLLCPVSDFRPVFHPDVRARFLDARDDDSRLVAYQTIFSEVLLERPWEATPEAIREFRSQLDRAGGRRHALATLAGTPVGTGFISSLDGVCELTRIATVPEARRRGVAATLTSFMLRDRFERGDTLAWLTATGVPAQSLYQKLGFRLVGERLYYRAMKRSQP
jgi:ribosomal protein S18 acetylase RimI-like enzyme